MNRKFISISVLIFIIMTILSGCTKSANKVDKNIETENETTLYMQDIFTKGRRVIHMDNGDTLIDEKGNYLSNIYDEIEEEDLEEDCDYIRFAENGKWGYLSLTGDVYIPAQYSTASPYSVVAVVGDGKKKWVINEKGKQISKKFEDICEYEHQECFARVKDKEKWGIIDRDANIVIACEFDKINDLPYIYTLASAVKDGKAYIISLYDMTINEVGEYSDIQAVCFGQFCNVKDKKGNVGLIFANGKQIFEPKYKQIYVKIKDKNLFLIMTKDLDGQCTTWQFNNEDKSIHEMTN